MQCVALSFSCKGRGFCPSCGSRRREQTADRLEREVWPVANMRQWVLTFPYQMRYCLARSPNLFAEVIRVVTDEISFFYEHSSIPFDKQEHAQMPSSGAITFIQRFGSSLTCNPHLHMIFLDGAYARTNKGLKFFPYQTFSTEAMFDVLTAIVLTPKIKEINERITMAKLLRIKSNTSSRCEPCIA